MPLVCPVATLVVACCLAACFVCFLAVVLTVQRSDALEPMYGIFQEQIHYFLFLHFNGSGFEIRSCLKRMWVYMQCAESSYINSRPFRVNAGPVHAYTAVNGDSTAYLAELKAGQEALVVDAQGRYRSEVIGRCKVPFLVHRNRPAHFAVIIIVPSA